LTIGETCLLKGDVANAKAGVLKKCAGFTTTAFRLLHAIERPSGPNIDDFYSIYLILLSQIQMIQRELGVCIVKCLGCPKKLV
jgi:hypothetical protein